MVNFHLTIVCTQVFNYFEYGKKARFLIQHKLSKCSSQQRFEGKPKKTK